jgi:hypothetical protein
LSQVSLPPTTPLRQHVASVVGRSTNPQVRRVAAWWVVASVADVLAVWDCAVSELVGNAGSRRTPAIDCHSTVSAAATATSPRPTSIRAGGLVNAAPEPALRFTSPATARPQGKRHVGRVAAQMVPARHNDSLISAWFAVSQLPCNPTSCPRAPAEVRLSCPLVVQRSGPWPALVTRADHHPSPESVHVFIIACKVENQPR